MCIHFSRLWGEKLPWRLEQVAQRFCIPVPGKASIHAGLQPLAQVAQAFFKVSHEKYQVFFFAEKSFQIAIY
jgi:hypothetical protein